MADGFKDFYAIYSSYQDKAERRKAEAAGDVVDMMKLQIAAEESEKDRKWQEHMATVRSRLTEEREVAKELRVMKKAAFDLGIDLNEMSNKVTTQEHKTPGLNILANNTKVTSDTNIVDKEAEYSNIQNIIKLGEMGKADAIDIDTNYDGKFDINELRVFQTNHPQLLTDMGLTEFPKAYLDAGEAAIKFDPAIRKTHRQLRDLTQMLEAQAPDFDPNTPGYQPDPSDPRIADIQNALDMIKLRDVPNASTAIRKVTSAKHPLARTPYTPTETTILESQGYTIETDPHHGAVVKRSYENIRKSDEFQSLVKQRKAAIDSLRNMSREDIPEWGEPGFGDPEAVSPERKEQVAIIDQAEEEIDAMAADTDVSREEAAKIIMTQKDKAATARERKERLRITDVMEEKEKESFEGLQDTKYKQLHMFFQSGPLYTGRQKKGEYAKGTDSTVKKIFEESDVLFTLLGSKQWHPTVSGKHEEGSIKGYQKGIEDYIVEIMDYKGRDTYNPDSELQKVFDIGAKISKNQGAKNVLNSPKFRKAVDPMGDGTYDKKEASKNLNALFDFHGTKLWGYNKWSLAQGEAIAHLYSVWKGLEDELLRRRAVELDRIDAQRD